MPGLFEKNVPGLSPEAVIRRHQDTKDPLNITRLTEDYGLSDFILGPGSSWSRVGQQIKQLEAVATGEDDNYAVMAMKLMGAKYLEVLKKMMKDDNPDCIRDSDVAVALEEALERSGKKVKNPVLTLALNTERGEDGQPKEGAIIGLGLIQRSVKELRKAADKRLQDKEITRYAYRFIYQHDSNFSQVVEDMYTDILGVAMEGAGIR